MKKISFRIGIFLLAAMLVLGTPHAYERLLPVHKSAASALAGKAHDEVGDLIVDCLNQRNAQNWDLRAYHDPGGDWSATHYFVSGRFGWSLSWAAVVPVRQGAPIAYETLGAANGFDGGRHRAALPWKIIGSLKRCGVAFGGIYPSALPSVR